MGSSHQSMFNYVISSWRAFRQQWARYLVLTGMMSAGTSWVLIPVLRWLVARVLDANHVTYLTLTNLVPTFFGKPVAGGLLLLIGLGIVGLVYFEFIVLLTGVAQIRDQRTRGWRPLLQISWRRLRQTRLTSLGLFILYVVLLVPFSVATANSSLLAKVVIPNFIIDFLGKFPGLTVALFGLSVLLAYLGIRLMRVLPHMVCAGAGLRAASRQSWRETRDIQWQLIGRFVTLTLSFFLVDFAWSSLLVGCQKLLDRTPIAFAGALVIASVLIFGRLVLAAATTTLMVFMMLSPRTLTVDAVNSGTVPKQGRFWRLTGAFLIVLGCLAYATLSLQTTKTPLMISHRGVDAGNGVQNTLPSLRRTAKLKPDFVEIDVHETKDNDFIMMHDENLRALTGVNATPRQRTLAQLTRLTAKENGHTAHLVSFEDYLTEAEKLGQRLVVELKPTTADSKHMVQTFMRRYGTRLEKDGNWIQSLNYPALVAAQKTMPKLSMSLILPYTFVLPRANFNAYTLEETTLSSSIVRQAHADHQQIWGWTVNDEQTMVHMTHIGVDGVITDNLSELQRVVASQKHAVGYAYRIAELDTLLQFE